MKSHAQVKAMSLHHSRSRQTPNASGAVPTNLYLRHGASPDEAVRSMLPAKRRKNSVIGVEMLLTASPEYFRPDVSQAGAYSRSRLEKFTDACMKWLRSRFGEQLASVTLHTDEVTPHFHVALVPLVGGRLNAREMFGGRAKLRELQDSFAQALNGLGLERGIRGSAAKHQKVQRFYGKIGRMEKVTLDMPPRPPEVPGGAEGLWYLVSGKAKADQKEYESQRVTYKQELRDAVGTLVAKAAAYDDGRRSAEARKSEIVIRRAEMKAMRDELEGYKQQIATLKEEAEGLSAQVHELQKLERKVQIWEQQTGQNLERELMNSSQPLRRRAFGPGN